MHVWNFMIYLQTHASGVRLGAGLLQLRDGMNCGNNEVSDKAPLHPIALTRKHLLSTELLGILHGLEKFHHYCFARRCLGSMHNHWPQAFSCNAQEGCVHIVSEIQCIILRIHQCRVHIIYQPGSDLYIADRLSHYNHAKNKDQGITGMSVNVSVISTSVNIPVCTSIDDIPEATHEDAHLQKLRSYITYGWPHRKHDLKHYLPIRSKLTMMDGIAMKGRKVKIPFLLQKQILQQLLSSHMGIEKTRLYHVSWCTRWTWIQTLKTLLQDSVPNAWNTRKHHPVGRQLI